MTLAIFDLDGTITRKDTFLEFLKFTHGKFRFYLNFLLISPFVIAFYLKLYKNDTLKSLVLKLFYQGENAQDLQVKGNEFAQNILPKLCYQKAIEKLNEHKMQGHEVIILSASCSLWIKSWCEINNFTLICTEMEIKNDNYTGNLSTPNCYGKEKVKRLEENYDLSKYFIYAYGDTPSDKYFLNLANQKHYQVFET